MKKRYVMGTQMRDCTFSLLQTSTVPFLSTSISLCSRLSTVRLKFPL